MSLKIPELSIDFIGPSHLGGFLYRETELLRSMQPNVPGPERRHHPRFQLSSAERPSRIEIGADRVLLGSSIDISQGGLKVQLNSHIPLGMIFKCELGFADVPVLVPTLMQAQWSQEVSTAYLVGLRFII